ncbi:MAG: phosphoribosylglycinamide formyltransferase [Bacteroidetes bacterium]|nr:phosphoribosylglycinamide formyltransferase [Bacteroidota bacterium]
MLNVAVFASGTGSNAENLFNYFEGDNRIKFKIVVTNNADAKVVAMAEKHKKNVQIISKQSLQNYSNQLIEFLKVEKIDFIILAGFLLKIPEPFIKAFPNKIINLHPSLLPKYGGKGMYGDNVHNAVLNNDEKESGITIHFVNEEYDKGKVLLQAKCAIDENETIESLTKKIRQLEFKHLPEVVEMFLQD